MTKVQKPLLFDEDRVIQAHNLSLHRARTLYFAKFLHSNRLQIYAQKIYWSLEIQLNAPWPWTSYKRLQPKTKAILSTYWRNWIIPWYYFVIEIEQQLRLKFWHQIFIVWSLTFRSPTPLLICTWFPKNQFGKIKFDELDF